jgi:tRNA-specific 2-thiouridylase
MGKPYYVASINAVTNEVVVGSREECLSSEVYADMVSLVYAETIPEGMPVECKVRSGMQPEQARLYNCRQGARVVFDKPVWAPAPGQSAVFYESGMVFGGGVIKEVQLKYKM